MKQMYLNRIIAQERFENGPKTVRVKSRIGSRLVRKSLDSFLTRFCLISLFLILMGGFTTEVWGAWSGSGQGTLKNGVWYVLYEDGAETAEAWGGTKEYSLSGPGKELTFQGKNNCKLSTTTTSVSVEDNKGTTLWSGTVKKSYANKTASSNCNIDATKITFKNATVTAYTFSFKTVHVTMAQYLENPSATSLNCGSAYVDEDSTSNSFTIAWCNVPAMTFSLSGADKGKFRVYVTNNSQAGYYNTATITVKYAHTEVGSHTAKLTVTDTYGSYSKEISLSGVTKIKTPKITWSPDSRVFNAEDVLTASSALGTTVTLSVASGNAAYVSCSENTATMLAPKSDSILVTATIIGNEKYKDTTYTRNIWITSKEKQTISWSQEYVLAHFKTTDATKSLTLNATASSHLPVRYELVGDKTGLTLTQNGNTWTLTYSATECKNTTIVAKQDGDEEYAAAASVSFPVKVIDPTQTCGTSETLINSTVTLRSDYRTYNIEIPASLSISISRTSSILSYSNGFKIEFYSQKDCAGTPIKTVTYTKNDINKSKSDVIDLTNYIHAKSLKITSEAINGYDVTSLSYTKRKYHNISTSSLALNTSPNTESQAQTVTVGYANYPISLECSNSNFSFTPTEFGDCDAYGSKTVSVTYTAGADEGNDSGYLYVLDNTGATLETCTLTVSISRLPQSITSTTIASSYNTTDLIELSAEANSGLTAFEYSARPAGIASFDGNVMTFSKSGTIAITATQPGSNIYSSASTTVNGVQVNKVTPTIATNPTVETIHYLDQFANDQFSDGLATVTLRGKENTPVAGKFSWTTLNGTQVTDAAGEHTYSVTFTPTDSGMYNPVTFTMPVTIYTATTPTLTMNNTSVDVSRIVQKQGIDHKKLVNLTSLVSALPATNPMDNATFTYAFKSVDTSDAAFAGSAACDTSAHIDNTEKTFYATEVGVYTITATTPVTSYYASRSVDFTITVNKLQPTLSFSDVDIVYKVQPVRNAAICVCEGETIATPCIRYSSDDENIIKEQKIGNEDAYQLICVLDDAAQVTSTTITASYAGNAYFLPAESINKSYNAIPKYSPLFFVDESDDNETIRNLHVGETATASFVYCVDYDAPSPQVAMTYSINPSSNVIEYNPATKTITAVGAGTATITFTQGTDAYRYPATRTFTFSVLKNATNITLASQVENASQLYVGDKLTGTLYTAETNEVPVDFSSTNTNVINLIDGELRALSEGDATITFSITPIGTQALKWDPSSASKTLHVSRRSNTLTSDHTSITKSYGGSEVFTFTAKNTDYENYPINLEAVTNSDLVTITRTAGNAFRVMAKHTEGTVTLRATQDISNEYVGATLNGLTFTVGKSNYHVPIDLNASKYNDTYCRTASEGTVSASSDEIQLGKDYWGGTDWDDKYVVFRFEGIPDKLTFGYKGYCTVWDLLGNLNELTNVEWYVQESVDGNFGNDKPWSSSRTDQDSYESVSIQLQPSTRYIKLCYSGNYAGIFKDIHVSERSELAAPDPATTSAAPYIFESKPLGADDSEKQFFVDWYNIDKVTVTSSDETHFSVAPASFADYEDYGQVAITVIYHRSVDINTHNATITITNGTQTRYIYVQGETTKKTATITWHPEIEACGFLMNPDEVYPSGAIDYVAQISNGGNLSISSETEGVISVENNILTAHNVANGSTTKITVNYAGSSEFYPAKLEQVFTVTTDTKQKISWPRTFMNLQLGGTPIPLDAQASSHGTVTYSVADGGEGIVTVVNGALTIVGAGDTYITANQSGGNINGVTYAPISQTKRVHVSDPNLQCTDYAIYNQSCTFASRPQTNAIVFTLDGPAANSVSFSAYHDKPSGTLWDNFEALGSYNYGPLVIEEYRYNNNTWEWHPIFNQVVNKETATDYSADVDPTTTKLRFYSNEAVTHHISNITLSRRKEVSASETSINASADCNVLYQKTIRIFHSGVDVLTTSVNGGFRLDKETLGEGCGTYGYEDLTVSITPSELTTYSGTIVITDGKTNETRLEIPISVVAQPVSQTIIDFYTEATYNTTDDIQFAARVLSGNTVYYTSSNENIATVDASGKMHITTSGTVTITAHCDATGFYAAAPDAEHTFTINKVTPMVSVAPSASDIDLPATLGSSQIDPTDAVMVDDKGTAVTGTYAWADGSMDTHKGEDQYPAIFTPDNSNWYTTADVDITVNVNARGKSIQWSLEDNASFYCFEEITFDAVTVDDLTGEVVDRYVSYTTSAPDIAEVNEVGTLIVHQSGVVTITASASAAGYYDAAQSVSRQIHLNKATPTIVTAPTATPISKEQPLQRSYFHSYSVKVGEYDVPGNFVWDNPEEIIQTPGTYTKPAHFVPSNSVYYNSVGLAVAIRVVQSFWTFVGSDTNHDFGEPTNWSNAGVPNEVQPDITVEGNLSLTSDKVLSSMLIDQGGQVTVSNGAHVIVAFETVLSESGEYGDLIVENGAEVELNTPMNVRNFILRSTPSNDYDMGTSGQITNAENLNIVNGDVYFELELSPYVGAVRANGEYWYGFSVPFPVDRSNGGIARYDLDEFGNGYWNDNLEFDEDYVLASYNSTRRASGLAGWRMYSNPVLYPGQFYMLVNRSTSGERYRFRMDQSLAWQTSESLPVATYFNPSNCDAEGVHNQGDDNWNALANPNLLYSNTDYNSVLFAQIYLNGRGVYKPVQLSETKFVVGAPFFIQSVEAGTMIMRPIDDDNVVSAPQRNTGWHSDIYKLTFAAEQQSLYADQIFLSASEDALDSYEFGKDLEKFEATVNEPQVWVMAYNRHLCANNAVLENGTAIYSLALRAPQTASYVIDLVNPSEETVIYLTYQGNVIWNLSQGAYTFDLVKGLNKQYGIMLVDNRQNISTDVEETNQTDNHSKVEKVIINNRLYIIKDGVMYDATGVKQ